MESTGDSIGPVFDLSPIGAVRAGWQGANGVEAPAACLAYVGAGLDGRGGLHANEHYPYLRKCQG